MNVNNILRLIQIHKHNRSDEELELRCYQALGQKLFKAYCSDEKSAFIEITFQDFYLPVLFMDKMNLNLRKKLDIPQSLVEEDESYQTFLASLKKAPGS